MAADGALAEDDQVARQDVRAFHRDADGRSLPATRQVIARPEHHALAAMHVHGIGRDHATQLGHMHLQDGGGYSGLLAAIDGAGGDSARRIHDVGVADDARDDLLDAFELAHRSAELLADARVRTSGPGGRHRAAGGRCWQRDAAAHRQLLDEHAPAAAGHLHATDDVFQRHEHVLTLDGSVLERDVQREVPAPDADARRAARNQRAGDADVLGLADQMPGIEQPEREADDRVHRRQRDVALGEVEPDADDFATFELAAAHDAGVRDRGGVGARHRLVSPKQGTSSPRASRGR